jgi:hypothetical protein
MILDAQLSFVPIGGNLAILGAAVPSPNVIDLLGVGAGVAPPSIFGNTTVFGQADAMGVGGARPELNVTVGTAFSGGGTSVNVALQGAIDSGVGGGYQPGAWNTFAESGLVLTANLVANAVIFRVPWLPPFPANLRPRFLRLLFTPAGTYTNGTIASALVTLVRDDQFNRYAARNYNVA